MEKEDDEKKRKKTKKKTKKQEEEEEEVQMLFFKQIRTITIKVSHTQNRLAERTKKRFKHKTSTFVSRTFCTPDRAIIRQQGEKISFCAKVKKYQAFLKSRKYFFNSVKYYV